MTHTKLLTPQEVVSAIMDRTGVVFSTKRIHNLSQAGQFPEPVTRINAKTIYWSAKDVTDWLSANFSSASA